MLPLHGVPQIDSVEFRGIPACSTNSNLDAISRIEGESERTARLMAWLADNVPPEPPEPITDGPQFAVPDDPPITLIDLPLGPGEDHDQAELHNECRIKTEALQQIAGSANNVSPRLGPATDRYQKLIQQDSTRIGARGVWSIANTLETVWEVHQNAIDSGRPSEKLPPDVAACLDDLLQTHRVWFLGHPGAREVEARASRHPGISSSKDRRDVAIAVVAAAEASKYVAPQATQSATEYVEASTSNTASAIAALGELEEWAWNFVATISRKIWSLAKESPGGFVVHSIAGYYLVEFVLANEPALRGFALNVMSHGPLWWDALLAILRR